MDIRIYLQQLRSEIKNISHQLNNEYNEQKRNGITNGSRQRIAHFTLQKKELRKRIDTIIDGICSDTNYLERKSIAIVETDRANIENANLKQQRKIDTHVRERCLNSVLRSTWSARTFPYFKEILETDNLTQVKQLAISAIYQRALLDMTLGKDSSLMEQYEQQFSTLAVTDKNEVETIVNKILQQTNSHYEEYQSLLKELKSTSS